MKAVVFHDVGDVRLDDVDEPKLVEPTDAIVRITASAICGTDLHMVRGTMSGMKPGTILGHEGVGIVEEVGASVRNLVPEIESDLLDHRVRELLLLSSGLSVSMRRREPQRARRRHRVLRGPRAHWPLPRTPGRMGQCAVRARHVRQAAGRGD